MNRDKKAILTAMVAAVAAAACGESPVAPPTEPTDYPYEIIQDGEEIPGPPGSVWAFVEDTGEAGPQASRFGRAAGILG